MSLYPNKIKVIVITIPNEKRAIPLEKSLALRKKLEVIKFDAIMYKEELNQYRPNFEKQIVLYGRKLSNGEIGCAISHQVIQDRYKLEQNAVVILEDDARITDVEEFERLVFTFVGKYGSQKAVLSLLPWSNASQLGAVESKEDGVIPLLGTSPLTVGYVITPQAMCDISAANSDFSYLPDWPPTNTDFYITKRGVIRHGDDSTYSLIDRSGRKKTRKSRAILRLTFIIYILHRRHFLSVTEYYNFAIKPAITWRLDKLRLR